MKIFLRILAAVAVMATSAHAGNQNKAVHHDQYHHGQGEAQIDGTMYDLTVPWPFRKARGTDTDGDGVIDSADRCPGTPSNARVDKFGCPEMAETRAIFLDTGKVTAHDIAFDTENATIKRGTYATLHHVGRTIESWPDLKVEIAGHTDSEGAANFNQALSEQRAQSVRSYLLDNFKIDSSRLVAVGYGEKKPIASNDTDKGRAQNRRVEFNVLNVEKLKRSMKNN